jgi:hypothetical protein
VSYFLAKRYAYIGKKDYSYCDKMARIGEAIIQSRHSEFNRDIGALLPRLIEALRPQIGILRPVPYISSTTARGGIAIPKGYIHSSHQLAETGSTVVNYPGAQKPAIRIEVSDLNATYRFKAGEPLIAAQFDSTGRALIRIGNIEKKVSWSLLYFSMKGSLIKVLEDFSESSGIRLKISV